MKDNVMLSRYKREDLLKFNTSKESEEKSASPVEIVQIPGIGYSKKKGNKK